MSVPSPDILSRVLGGGAFLLALWAFCRIGLWLLADLMRDVGERIEGDWAQSGGAGEGTLELGDLLPHVAWCWLLRGVG